MVFSISLFVCSWIAYWLFAKKKRLLEYAPTCYVAMILGLASDVLIDTYGLWRYPSSSKLQSLWRHFLDDFGIYFVVTYLFLQTLPAKQTVPKMIRHIFYWSLVALALEGIARLTGNIRYGLWWNIWYSYLADWLLFVLFFFHHKWIRRR